MKIRIPSWLKRNAPAILAQIAEYLAKRRGASKKVGVLLAALLLLAACGIKLPDIPWPLPSASPVPSPSPESSPSPLPEASPSPVPTPTPTPPPIPSPTPPTPSPCTAICAPPPAGFRVARGVSPYGYGPEPGVCYAPVKDDWNMRYDPPIDDSISWDTCDTCAGYRSYNVQQGHWINEGRPDGWLRYNSPGQPGSDKFVTKDCDLVTATGVIVTIREEGRIGKICPRKLSTATCPSPLPAPSPLPSPSNSPTPIPSGAPPKTESGNYPRPEIGTCPPHFQNQPFSMHVKVACKVKGNGGRRCTLDLTQRSETPWMEHTCYGEDGSYSLSNCKPVSEMWRGCQEPRYVDYIEDERGDKDPNPGDGIVMTIFHPLWGYYGACDKITAPPQPGMTNPRENYRCQDSDEENERGAVKTKYRVCMPDGTRCVEGEY